MKIETREGLDGTSLIEIGGFCDSSEGHIKELELGREPVWIDEKHTPLSESQLNIDALKETVKEHLASSPNCNQGTISYVGLVGSSPVNFRI